MTLDLTRPEHREALRWACNWAAYDPAFLVRVVGSEDALENPDTRDNALAARAISSPSDSAALVRALLEGCGSTLSVTTDRYFVQDTDGGPFREVWWLEGYDGAALVVEVEPERIPALVLRLLACTTKEEALAALREIKR